MKFFDWACLALTLFIVAVLIPAASRKEADYQQYRAIIQPFERAK